MEIINIDKNRRTQKLIEQLLAVWENSVKATHLFLSENEIENIKQYVLQALKEITNLIIVVNKDNDPIAFMGIEKNKLEMLFISDKERGKGIGSKLIQYGIKKYSINELTVNEQNPKARNFYEHTGFRVYKKTETDEQGNPYPLLYMRLHEY
ncbi:GNAT family N-acetyltransferase [Candidatus Gastranaerophilales bacterium]|nr:MAG: GNAT family N-acetyltransferase [Candidatus Gastranaerophilales bacterium]